MALQCSERENHGASAGPQADLTVAETQPRHDRRQLQAMPLQYARRHTRGKPADLAVAVLFTDGATWIGCQPWPTTEA